MVGTSPPDPLSMNGEGEAALAYLPLSILWRVQTLAAIHEGIPHTGM